MKTKLLSTFLFMISLNVFAQNMSENTSKTVNEIQKPDPLEEIISSQNKNEMKKTPSASDLDNVSQSTPKMLKQEDKKNEVKKEIKKEEKVAKLTKEESELLKSKFRPLKSRPDLLQEIEDEKKQLSPIYSPAPTREKNDDGFIVERDSTKIVTKRMSVTDSLNLKICFNAGVQITLDEDISTTLQTILLDDKIFFDSLPFDNNRGAYVRLKTPVPEGMYWESSIRLVRKSDDKAYLINLYALPCPVGPYPFPKIVYLKEKRLVLNKKNNIFTPEDTIIAFSEGLPRVQKNRIRVYDMVTSPGSDWAVFGVEIQFPNRKSKDFNSDLSKYFKFLDNLQINSIDSKIEYLPIQSEKSTQSRGISTMRFKITVNINKNYIINNRYLHMMFVDKEESHYQFVRIDILPYFLSLKKRGFEL